jgi:hypothetical protein
MDTTVPLEAVWSTVIGKLGMGHFCRHTAVTPTVEELL